MHLPYMRKCKRFSLHPNEHTIVKLLKSCAKLKDVEKGSKLHAHIVKRNLLKGNVFIGTALVDMYGKCGKLAKAQDTFDQLQIHDVVAWNALIAGYVRQEMVEEALNCFEQMQIHAISPDAATFSCTLKACGVLRDVEKGAQICALIERKRLWETSLPVGNAMIDMYVKCGFLEKAQDVFHKLPVCNVISWTALISGYVQHEYMEEALHCFCQMRLRGVSPDVVTYSCILQACGVVRDLDMGEEMYSEIKRKGMLEEDQVVGVAVIDMYTKCGSLTKAHEVFEMLPIQNLVSWTTLIVGYVQHRHAEEGLNCFERMKIQGVSPDAVTFAYGLKACGSIGALDKGMELHDDIVHRGMIENHIVGNALIDMYAKCGMVTRAREVFDNRSVWDIIAWNSLLTGYSQLGDLENVVGMLDKMNEKGIKPDLIAFTCVLNACSHAGLLNQGRMFFNYFHEDYSMVPTFEHFTCMIDLFGRAGQLDMALAIVMKAPCCPNMFMWAAILGACRKWNKIDLARSAFEHAMPMGEKEVGAYICMLNIYGQDDGMTKQE